MTRTAKLIGICLALFALALPALARRDPLTAAETDQLRETAADAPARLKLFIKFARARMGTLLQLRSDPRFATRGPQVHDLLEDVGVIVEEMDDNIDMYAGRQVDLRKPLKDVLEADTEFQLKLRGLKEAANHDAALAEETKQYTFVLDNALETVNSSLDNTRKLMQEQEVAFKNAKEKKK
jgi:hypothetical protein